MPFTVAIPLSDSSSPKITAAFLRVEKKEDQFVVVGLSITKEEGTWYLLPKEDQPTSKHKYLESKVRNLRVQSYRNFDIAEPDIAEYLDHTKTKFMFGGKFLQLDLDRSITDKGTFVLRSNLINVFT